MSVATQSPARPAGSLRVTRSRRNVAWTGLGALIVVVVLALLPYIVYSGTTSIFVQGFIVLTLASMWNLLAGYAGLVSVGQQVFVGLGAYFVLILAIHGWSPFAALPIAAIGCAVAALPLWWLVARLRSGYFAIATWVLAATVMLIIEKFSSIGGGTGMPLPGLTGMDSTLLTAYTYWIGLAVTVATLATIYLLLRGRLGLVLTAIRDDEVAARSSGARVGLARVLVFVIAGCGCGAAGGRCWPSASCRSSRARCSACSGRPRWRSPRSSAAWARSRDRSSAPWSTWCSSRPCSPTTPGT